MRLLVPGKYIATPGSGKPFLSCPYLASIEVQGPEGALDYVITDGDCAVFTVPGMSKVTIFDSRLDVLKAINQAIVTGDVSKVIDDICMPGVVRIEEAGGFYKIYIGEPNAGITNENARYRFWLSKMEKPPLNPNDSIYSAYDESGSGHVTFFALYPKR